MKSFTPWFVDGEHQPPNKMVVWCNFCTLHVASSRKHFGICIVDFAMTHELQVHAYTLSQRLRQICFWHALANFRPRRCEKHQSINPKTLWESLHLNLGFVKQNQKTRKLNPMKRQLWATDPSVFRPGAVGERSAPALPAHLWRRFGADELALPGRNKMPPFTVRLNHPWSIEHSDDQQLWFYVLFLPSLWPKFGWLQLPQMSQLFAPTASNFHHRVALLPPRLSAAHRRPGHSAPESDPAPLARSSLSMWIWTSWLTKNNKTHIDFYWYLLTK